MKRRISINLWVLLLTFMASSCNELQSDAELREDIIGTWLEVGCKYPNNTGNDPDAISHPMRRTITFYSDGRFTEGGDATFCTLDTCGAGWTQTDCRCEWSINEGKLMITPVSGSSSAGHLFDQYPIKCLKNDKLIFDNARVLVSSNWYPTKKACYERQ